MKNHHGTDEDTQNRVDGLMLINAPTPAPVPTPSPRLSSPQAIPSTTVRASPVSSSPPPASVNPSVSTPVPRTNNVSKTNYLNHPKVPYVADSVGHSDNLQQVEDAEQKVINSCRNIVDLASEALEENKNFNNVVIMEHPPRFDDNSRTQSARFANTTLNQLWASSPHKDRIVIGRHSLESPGVGKTHLTRYKDYTTGMYDGVHFYGPAGGKVFTDSVKTILMLALSDSLAVSDPPTSVDDHLSCEQAQYQWEQEQSLSQVLVEEAFLVDLCHTDQKCSQSTGCSSLICSLNSSSFLKFPTFITEPEDGLEKGKWEHKEKMRNKSINGRNKSGR